MPLCRNRIGSRCLQCVRNDLCEGHCRTADEPAQRVRVIIESTVRCLCLGIRDNPRKFRRQKARKDFLVLGFRQIVICDRFANLFADFRGKLCASKGRVRGKLIDLVLVALARKRSYSRICVLRPRCGGDPAIL